MMISICSVLFSISFGMSQDAISVVKSDLDKRDSPKDEQYYLDSLIKYASPGSSEFGAALFLKSQLLKQNGKDVEALQCLKQITESESSSASPFVLGKAYLAISDIYTRQKSFQIAENYLTEAYIIFDGIDDITNKALVLVKTANVSKIQGEIAAAIRHLKQAHAIYDSQNKTYVANELAQKIGALAFESGEFSEAETYLNLALKGFVISENYDEQTRVYETLSQICDFEKRYDEKISVQKKLLKVATLHKPNEFVAKKHEELSVTYSKLNRWRDALTEQEKAVNILTESLTPEKYKSLLRLSELYKINNRETDAILTLHNANNTAINLSDKGLVVESSKVISKFYRERGEWEKAHNYLSYSDSVSTALYETKIRKLESAKNKAKIVASEDLTTAGGERVTLVKGLSSFWKVIIGCSILVVLLALIFLIRVARKRNKLRQILEWKVYKRTKELRSLNSELNTYIYKSSHDLRNPLTSIKSLITLIQKEDHTQISEKYLGLIESCADQMDEILLNLSRAVDYKKVDVKVQQVDFNSIKAEIEKIEFDNRTGMELSWNIREKAPFFSDPNLIKVILNKTITNAMQYRIGSSQDFCKISITTDSSGAHVCVEDNGQGIAEKIKDSVFDMFVKGTHKSKGAGLGLYLVKIAADKIRASIALETRENKGSKLVFELPNLA